MCTDPVDRMVRVVRKRAEPLSHWIERVIRLPRGDAADPGPIKLYPYQRGIANAIADPKIERITTHAAFKTAHSPFDESKRDNSQ